ncbi:MAG TPA: DUF4270 family protein [Chitinophagaceae bacterium]|nr:DUF4270 family protein [Chitinophagaceae bacterium]
MKRKLLLLRYPLYFLFFLFYVVSCTKIDTTTIGGGILPSVDNINTFEQDLDVITKNYTDTISDSAFIFSSDPHILGLLNDPVFGKTQANLYFQVTPPVYPFTFSVGADSLFLDSAVLVVRYSAAYGDTLAKQRINVYRITDDSFSVTRKLSDATTAFKFYRINEDVVYDNSQVLGSAYVSPSELRPQRILGYKKDSLASMQLRIRLDDNFGRSFLDQGPDGGFVNDSIYRATFLKGFALVPEASAGGNALMYFQTSADTRLLIYHRIRKRDGSLDTTVQPFSFSSFSAAANYINRDRSSGEIAGHLDNNQPDDMVYLQGTPGTYARVWIPGLDTLSNRIIHRAELVVKQVWAGPQMIEDYLYPANLIYPEVFNTETGKIVTDDSLIFNPFLPSIYTPDFFVYVDGARRNALDLSANSVANYRINLTRYIQGVITRKNKNFPLHLTIPYRPLRFYTNSIPAPFSPLGAGKLRAGGGSHPQYKMYLRIIYSKIQ